MRPRIVRSTPAALPTVAVTPNHMKFLLTNYDGGFPVHPTKEKRGELVLTIEQKWELHFRGTNQYAHGGLIRVRSSVTKTGSNSCRVTFTDTQEPSVTATFELPLTPAADITRALVTYSPRLVAPPRKVIAPRVITQLGVADEIAKLGELRSQGLLTDEEFNAQKLKLLGRP